VHLGNAATADVFVNAVCFHRPSIGLGREDGVDYQRSSMVSIRVRVLPKGEEKKPFLIQKQFDIDGLRASIPAKCFQGSIVSLASTIPFDSDAQAE